MRIFTRETLKVGVLEAYTKVLTLCFKRNILTI